MATADDVPGIAPPRERRVIRGIDVQLEFLWTAIWAYLAAWTFGAPSVFPSDNPMWNGPSLFFLLCLGFYELQTGATTNPAYWLKDFFVDEVSERKFRKAPFDRVLLMGAVDVVGHCTGFYLYLKTLELLGETSTLHSTARPPSYKGGSIIWAFLVEAIVTGGTQLSSSIPEAFGITGRLGNLISSAVSVYGLMLWGLPYTGALMNPASSIAATIISNQFAKLSLLSPDVLAKVGVVFITAPFAGAVVAGIIEGGFERDRIKREKYE